MRFLRLSLILGGLFNVSMGAIFLSRPLILRFFEWAEQMEWVLSGAVVHLNAPAEPLHLMLIHGFGAAAVILGATLLYAAKNPAQMVPFILIDGVGRLLYAFMMGYYVLAFSLIRTILLFAIVEFALAVIYICFSWNRKWNVQSAM